MLVIGFHHGYGQTMVMPSVSIAPPTIQEGLYQSPLDYKREVILLT